MFVALKKIIAVTLSVLIFSQSMVHLGVALYYHLNKKYITEQLCENRKDPSKHCNGHCYLSKQLKKAEEGEKKQTAQIVKEKEEIISNNYHQLPETYFPAYRIKEFYYKQPTAPLTDYRSKLVKPPCA